MTEPTDQDRNWVAACSCGSAMFIRNAAIFRTEIPCDSCRGWGSTGGEPFGDIKNELVVSELGWCSCDRPQEVDRMMLSYLTARSADGWPKPHPEAVSDDAETLLAYIADDLGWTEHGSTVGGAWLTTDGTEAMLNLRAAAAPPRHEPSPYPDPIAKLLTDEYTAAARKLMVDMVIDGEAFITIPKGGFTGLPSDGT